MRRPPGPPAEGVEISAIDLAGVSCVVCEPARPIATLVYFHGGGYRLGSAQWSAGFGSTLAHIAETRVVLVDYGLAPEHPFPAALHDAAAALDGSRSRWPDPIAVGGDSAGGGLATALVVAARRAGVATPAGLVLLSPWLDLTVAAASYESRSTSDLLFSRVQAAEAAQLYLQGWDPRDPLVSPVFADLEGFPPVILFASTGEVLLDDSITFTERLARSAGPVQAHFVADVPHAWPVVSAGLPSSTTALHSIATFVASLTAAAAGGST
jgi:epsilon-lactone hydrolase